MQMEDSQVLDRIANTLEDILSELRKAGERHRELDETNAAAEYKLQNPYENV